jgi:GPH family glycoside/pentoside/hexuronide:cation symporter
VSAIGNNLPATLILFYVEYVLESLLADFFLMLYFVTGIIFLPAWIMISRRTGKKAAWLASMAINTGAFAGVFFLGPGDAAIYGILVFLSGMGLGATLAIPSAIQADVVDYDELLTGERRAGQYIGLWSISKKFAAAVGIGAGLSILGMVGYTPNVQQSAEVQMTLRVLYALVPPMPMETGTCKRRRLRSNHTSCLGFPKPISNISAPERLMRSTTSSSLSVSADSASPSMRT